MEGHLVEGASSLNTAIKCATIGTPISLNTTDVASISWTINENVRSTISGMLDSLLDLWPMPRKSSTSPDKSNAKSKEARKAAQQRVLDMMKQKQAAFAQTITKTEVPSGSTVIETDQEVDLCIICRCDDADGENNGPLGYLGHVQRSRVIQMRSKVERNTSGEKTSIMNAYRVVGHMGCQVCLLITLVVLAVNFQNFTTYLLYYVKATGNRGNGFETIEMYS